MWSCPLFFLLYLLVAPPHVNVNVIMSSLLLLYLFIAPRATSFFFIDDAKKKDLNTKNVNDPVRAKIHSDLKKFRPKNLYT